MLDKTCTCGCLYNTKYNFCPICLAESFDKFWYAKKNFHVSMHSNGDYFIAEIQAGMDGDNYLAVGYSCPNYAGITPPMIPILQKELDDYYDTVEEKDLREMLPTLYKLCEVANTVFNKLIWDHSYD